MDHEIQPRASSLEEKFVEERQKEMLDEAKKQAILKGEVEPSEETDEAYEPVVEEDMTIADVMEDD
jgi:hypothetical protein